MASRKYFLLTIALISLTWLKDMRFVFELLLDFAIFVVVVVAQQTVEIKVHVAAPEPAVEKEAVYRTMDAKGIVCRTNNISMTRKG